MNVPALIFWLVIVCSFWARPGTVLVLLLASIPFASLSLLPPEIIGGMSLLPQMMFAVVLIFKVVAPHVGDAISKVRQRFAIAEAGIFGPILVGGHSGYIDHAEALSRTGHRIPDANIRGWLIFWARVRRISRNRGM